MIDNGLDQYRASNVYDESSMEDARSMVDSIQNRDEAGRMTTEEDDIIGQTAALLANLKQS